MERRFDQRGYQNDRGSDRNEDYRASEKRFGLERRHHDSDREHPDDRRRQDSRRDRSHRQNDSLWKSRDSRADPRRDRRDSFDREKVTNDNQRFYCHECDSRLERDVGELYCPRCSRRMGCRDRDDFFHERKRKRSASRDSRRDSRGDRVEDEHDDFIDRKRNRPKFPGPFELYPEDYSLDRNTGYFLEEFTGFFHCPKSKLYYHPKSSQYFSFDVDEDKYMDVESDYGSVKMKLEQVTAPSTDLGDDIVVQALQGTKKSAVVKNKISITIKKQAPKKTKKVSRKQKETGSIQKVKAVTKESQQQKLHNVDIQKWSKVKEVEESSSHSDIVNLTKVGKTKSGLPVCMVCKRKFKNFAQCKKHFQFSELHKFNIGKRVKAQDKFYQDRALTRRIMYEDQSQGMGPILNSEDMQNVMAPSLDQARVAETEKIKPEDTLGTSNVGNKLLQKIGWKGGSLGKKTMCDGKDEASRLRQDWDRIEKAAKS